MHCLLNLTRRLGGASHLFWTAILQSAVLLQNATWEIQVSYIILLF